MSSRPTLVRPVLVAAMLSGLVGVMLSHAGPLNPPAGPVASSYKTLSEIEPRTAVNATNTPGDAASVFRITQPGSYYLTGNAAASGSLSAIAIAADDVTLDLSGFEISSSTTGIVRCILVSGARRNIHIKNGTARGAGGGIDATTAVSSIFENLRLSNNAGDGLATGANALIQSCTALDNTGNGINAGNASSIRDCTASGNNGTAGIQAGSSCTVSHCAASNNGGADGISVGAGSVVEACVADNNAAAGIYSGASQQTVIRDCSASGNSTYGFYLGNYCTVTGCVAFSNSNHGFYGGGSSTVTNCKAHTNGGAGIWCNGSVSFCSASNNTGDGIHGLGGFSTIVSCTCSSNTGNGLKLEGQSIALNNTCLGNGGAAAAGILVIGSDNRVEGNNVSGNHVGIQVTTAGNLILRNSAATNSTNYDIAASNRYGPIVNITATGAAAASGNTAASTVASTDPWANFAY